MLSALTLPAASNANVIKATTLSMKEKRAMVSSTNWIVFSYCSLSHQAKSWSDHFIVWEIKPLTKYEIAQICQVMDKPE